ncbi:anoctamin-5-like [Tachypleus tridentatus]|uniref:anoctamin-5-like n=1 Tax=Tachypleus tridentatus TaxID=6853 RepID=UPI003FD2F9A5
MKKDNQCGTRGCLFELSLQLSIIVVGKQFVNAVVEMGVLLLLRVYKKWSVYKKVLQFGFSTIFVATFPRTIVCYAEHHHKNQAQC